VAIDEEPAAPIPSDAPSPPAAGAPRRRHLSKGIVILMVLTAAAVVAPIVAVVAAGHAGSGPGSTGSFRVGIRNDTPSTLVARLCGSGCLPDVPSVTLTPGATTLVRASAGGAVTRYYLLDQSGAVVGCLPLRFAKASAGVSIAASRAEPCPGSPIG